MTGKMSSVIRFVKLTSNAYTPTRGSPQAAGLDLYSAYDATIPPYGKVMMSTDLQIQLPAGCYGQIAPRSELAYCHYIAVGGGVIDEDYRGNIGGILYNHSNVPFKIVHGDRIAHIICIPIQYPRVVVDVLGTTKRVKDGLAQLVLIK
jgi:dUTP pyrophosphatase